MNRPTVLLALLGILVMLVWSMMSLFATAPTFSSWLGALLYTLFLFLGYEHSDMHHSHERENLFWTVFSCASSVVFLFVPDSPVSLGLSSSVGARTLLVLVVGYVVHVCDWHHRRVSLSRLALRNHSSRKVMPFLSPLDRDVKANVDESLAKLSVCLKGMECLLLPSIVHDLFRQSVILQNESEVLCTFQQCKARELDYLLAHVRLGRILYEAKHYRTELVELLAVDRLSSLSVFSRVILLDALQLLKLSSHERAEDWAKHVILHTFREDLSLLKTLMDSKGDYNSMDKLIFDDIQSETLRQEILNHFRKEAELMEMRPHRRKILSDMDDTMNSIGGKYPAGIDKRYKHGVVYPGVLAFYRELDLGVQGPAQWPDDRVGNLVFYSARPHVYKDLFERTVYAMFEKLRTVGTGTTMHTVPLLLLGDLVTLGKFVFTNDMEHLAKKKYANFIRFASIYPEFNYVFICDNGQGDVRAGEMMFDSSREKWEVMYIHLVQDVSKTYGHDPERWKSKGLQSCFFSEYPNAALDAVQRDPPLMSTAGLRRVCLESAKDFYAISRWSSAKQKAERRAELNKSLREVNQYLERIGEDPVGYIEADSREPDEINPCVRQAAVKNAKYQ